VNLNAFSIFRGLDVQLGCYDAASEFRSGNEHMRTPPVLTADFCLQVVIDSTPHPGRFHNSDDPTTKELFDLGVVDALSSALFIQRVKAAIAPWSIKDASIQSSRNNTIQEAADSIQTGAQIMDTDEE
jgi:hypothetical protein